MGVERFDQLRVKVGRALHQLPLAGSIAPVGKPVDRGIGGHKSEGKKRELPRIEGHRDKGEAEDQRVQDQVEQRVVEKTPDLNRVRDPRGDLPHPHRIEKRLGQTQQMSVVGEY